MCWAERTTVPSALRVHIGAVAVPGGEAACQEALYGGSVEVPEDLCFHFKGL